MFWHNCYHNDIWKHDADEKEFAEITEKMTTQVTKTNKCSYEPVQAVENTWQEVITVKLK